MAEAMNIDSLLESLQSGGPAPGGSPGLGSGLGPGAMPGMDMPMDPMGMGSPMQMPGMGGFPGQPAPSGAPMGIGATMQMPGVSLEDTMKSNVAGTGPAIGSMVNPLDGGGMDAFMEDSRPQSMSTTQTVETTTDEIENPYAFPMDNAAQEAPTQIEETVSKTKSIAMYVAIGIVGVIVLFGAWVGIRKRITQNRVKDNPNPSSQQVSQQGQQGGSPQVPEYTGPRIQTAEPNAIAVNDTVYDDVMAITKQIQVENGSVECYLVGTPQYFAQKIKIPVTVQEYNDAKAADIVAIRYRVVKISGQDYVVDPYVVPKEVSG